MKDNAWYDVFIEKLYKKYPKRTQLLPEIMDLLHIERETVYRRLRKDVVFTAHEIAKLASTWNISLDNIMGIKSGSISFQMQPMNYLYPTAQDIKNLHNMVQRLEHVETVSESEYMEVCNRLPRSLTAGFTNLYRFEIFKWAYQYYGERNNTLFSQTIIPEKVVKELEEYNRIIKNMSNTYFLWDDQIFSYLVRNIRYFHSIMLISDEDKELIKKDMLSLLDYMLAISNTGCYPETQNKVNLYISQLNIDTNYSYIYTEKLKICRVHVFGKYDIYAYDPEMVDNFKTWMLMKRRTSIQISEVDEKNRIEYFAEQRKLVESL